LPKLEVKCKYCKKWFDSDFEFDEKSFVTAIMKANKHTCPKCGHTDSYNKEDYRFKAS